MEQPVLFEIQDQIAIITLNRPEKRNAMNQELLTNLSHYLRQTANEDTVRAAIVTGKGKSFSAGMDVAAIGPNKEVLMEGQGLDFGEAMAECKKPIIGAINGHAITGGFELALNCDFLIASERAIFRDTHALLGIHPAMGMTQLLQQAVGQRRAKQLSLTGECLPAQKALEWGLVNEVVPHNQLMPRAKEIAAGLCAVNQAMAAVMKDLIEAQNSTTLDEAYARERAGFAEFMKRALEG
jgi:enoyl-CoA hydratase